MPIVDAARKAAEKKLLFLPHAIRQMSRPERMIMPQEVERVVMTGELVEDYLNDSRGHSCLIGGWRHRTGDSCGMFPESRVFGCDYRLSS